jgi:hypothetical protein
LGAWAILIILGMLVGFDMRLARVDMWFSASSSLEGMTSKFDHVFSLAVPGITDNGWLLRDQRSEHARSIHLLQWGISTGCMSLYFLRPVRLCSELEPRAAGHGQAMGNNGQE